MRSKDKWDQISGMCSAKAFVLQPEGNETSLSEFKNQISPPTFF